MKKILIIILLIFVVGAVFLYYRNPDRITSGYEADRIGEKAAHQNDSSICGRIKKGFDIGPGPSEEELQTLCYIKMASILQDASSCENISNDIWKDICAKQVSTQ